MKQWLKHLAGLILGGLIAIAAWVLIVQQVLHTNPIEIVQNTIAPCSRPITYAIGTFDTHFGISKEKFLSSIADAEHIWEQPIHRELFAYDPHGTLKINLVYDYRQAATQKLQSVGIVIHDDQATYAALKKKYDALQGAYLQKKAAFDTQVATYEKQRRTYEAEVTYWNSRGGAPEPEFKKLVSEKEALQQQLDKLNASRAALSATVDTLNAMVVVLNKLISELNLEVGKYNGIGSQAGVEYNEGIYKSDSNGQEIDIYQYDDATKLVRVLAHELGNALDLPHNDNPAAIMYRLNQGTNKQLAADDLAALKTRCRIQEGKSAS